jgi:hypothetical protein
MKPLANEIIKFVSGSGSVSFAELERIEGFGGGELAWSIETEKVENVFLWINLTQEAVDAMKELHEAKFLEMKPTTFFVYACDGRMLTLPLAKAGRIYKKPHWLPVVFNATAAGKKFARGLELVERG